MVLSWAENKEMVMSLKEIRDCPFLVKILSDITSCLTQAKTHTKIYETIVFKTLAMRKPRTRIILIQETKRAL